MARKLAFSCVNLGGFQAHSKTGWFSWVFTHPKTFRHGRVSSGAAVLPEPRAARNSVFAHHSFKKRCSGRARTCWSETGVREVRYFSVGRKGLCLGPPGAQNAPSNPEPHRRPPCADRRSPEARTPPSLSLDSGLSLCLHLEPT